MREGRTYISRYLELLKTNEDLKMTIEIGSSKNVYIKEEFT